jgi:hypothetical protein
MEVEKGVGLIESIKYRSGAATTNSAPVTMNKIEAAVTAGGRIACLMALICAVLN